jgi:MATE family multidrug resistance protein
MPQDLFTEGASKPELRRRLGYLAVPLAGTQLTAVVLSATDTAMMGLLGVTALAAGGLSIVVFNQFRTIGTGLITSVGNEIASARPTRSTVEEKIVFRRELLRAGLLVATIAGLVGGTAIAVGGTLLTLLGQDVNVAATASPLLIALAPGLLPVLWFQVLRQYAIGIGKPQSILAITIASIALNVVLDVVLIYGWGPFPELGLTGVGVATTVVQFANFAALIFLVRRSPTLSVSFSLRAWKATKTDVSAITRHGYKIAATFGSSSFFYVSVAFIMGGISPIALAAHSIVYQIFSITFQIANGVSQASSILVSHLVSAKEYLAVAYINTVSLVSIATIAALFGLTYVLFPTIPLGILGAEPSGDLLSSARALLTIAIATQVASGFQNISVGVLRGLGNTSSSLRYSLIGYWIVGLPTALLLAFPAHLGPNGIWIGITLGLAFIGIALQIKIRRELYRQGQRALV